MSLFTRRQDPAVLQSSSTGYSVLDAQLTVRGDIETDGSVRIDGRLEGSIRRADVVVLGAGATIVGDVAAREVIVGGTLNGNIVASGRVELQPSATVTGDIQSGTILIQEGGVVQGRLTIHPISSPGRATPVGGTALAAAYTPDRA